MIHLKDVQDDCEYVIDLLQFPDGHRTLHLRDRGSPAHDRAALSTQPCSGKTVRDAFNDFRLFATIPLTDGQSFGVDPHTIWMTRKEIEYYKKHPNPENDTSDAPWVNGLRPLHRPA